ncbi:NAD-dependent epimerase/dehydratase family protein [Microbaculum marinisediminis]|uniref:NAD(P)-dependent oxidoreductase n=1 Tax=Microbaculum marinisediminis TaxID=2931392 RepID=A0AAW5R3T5_9HYPH|nr:NAD(P)-dependent oxidoreductase [Microbaculum sp. A6E488]MCT8973523.1 NAD(P)-dependent oxidoreductase [Microbaculum sp. A6E488]
MRRVVVTGASGLLGGYVARAVSDDAEVIGLDARPPAVPGDIAHVTASILDPDALEAAFAGADAVIHIAAAANIGSGTPGQIIDLNVKGSWCVLEAARRANVRRVVLCSSDSVMGNTVWKDHFWCPQALPVNEAHPVRPADPYALSKLLAEEAGRSFARRGLEIIALRPVFILFPSMMGEVLARHADPDGYVGPCAGGHAPAGGGPCWHHVDPRDVAEAFRLALRVDWRGYEAFYLAAPSTLHPLPTLDRIAQAFGGLPERIDSDVYAANPHAPMFDTRAARRRLGWRARHDLRADVLGAVPTEDRRSG